MIPVLCLALALHSGSAANVEPTEASDRMKALVTEFADPNRHWLDTATLNRVARLFRTRVEQTGIACGEQVFEVEKRTYRNIECTVPGKSKDLLIIGAHYDVAGNQPGADDNASGIAGLIELARKFSASKTIPRNTIRLVAYTLEEPPFYATESMGSFHHAKKLKDSGFTVKAMISLEMIGYIGDSLEQRYPAGIPQDKLPTRGDFLAAVSNLESARLTKFFKAVADKAKTLSVIAYNAPFGVDWSDHMNYWKFGFPAFMLTDTAFLRNYAYHTQADTPDRLNYQAMSKVVDLVFQFTATSLSD
jgi:Zn-dependent M28 family amino/carboxypeptidase